MLGALKPLPGVANVTVDFDAETATCIVDPRKFDGKKASEALAKAGFEGSTLIKDEPKKGDSPPGKEKKPAGAEKSDNP